MRTRKVDSDHLGNSYSPDLNGRRSFSIYTADRNWFYAGAKLPSIVVTEATIESKQLEETDALYSTPLGGRFRVMQFPEEAPEPLGESARYIADGYYYEGYYTRCDPLHLGKRIDCFRIAELFYLHAIARGCQRAHVGLGKIYYHDRCEGHYFDPSKRDLYAPDVLDRAEIQRRAHDHLRIGADSGDIEASYLYGDVLRNGVGCNVDFGAALDMYLLSLERTRSMQGVADAVSGCTHVRLARAYEEGEGCEVDFELALGHYEEAARLLLAAVERFPVRFDAELARAECGVARMKQELSIRERTRP